MGLADVPARAETKEELEPPEVQGGRIQEIRDDRFWVGCVC